MIFLVSALTGLVASPPGATADAGGETDTASYIVTFDESVVTSPGRRVGNLEEQFSFESDEVFSTVPEGFAADLSDQQVQ
jgi:hypothetical protein